MNRVKEILINVLTVISLLIVFCMVVSKTITGWSSIFSYRLFYIMSESMTPVIEEGDVILGQIVSEDDVLEIGKIYAYRRNGELGTEVIIHRLIGMTEENKCLFQGDYNVFPDREPVEREDIGYEIIGY